jgi:DNA-binding response OmpR family regulator
MARRILIAEDEPNIVTSLEFLMRKCDYEVCVARDGDEALELAEAFVPDLVLLDVMMPRRSGFEVCRRIRENPRLEATRIVMLSARGSEAEIGKGMALGADAYVTKPFSTRELVAKVRQLLPQSS